jgi:hypothetical protein
MPSRGPACEIPEPAELDAHHPIDQGGQFADSMVSAPATR